MKILEYKYTNCKIINILIDKIIDPNIIHYICSIYLMKFIDDFITGHTLFIDFKIKLLKELENKLIDNYIL